MNGRRCCQPNNLAIAFRKKKENAGPPFQRVKRKRSKHAVHLATRDQGGGVRESTSRAKLFVQLEEGVSQIIQERKDTEAMWFWTARSAPQEKNVGLKKSANKYFRPQQTGQKEGDGKGKRAIKNLEGGEGRENRPLKKKTPPKTRAQPSTGRQKR